MKEQPASKLPQIRFKGFEVEWEEKALERLFPITSAARVHKNEWTKSGVRFFRSSDVVSLFKGNDNTKAFISHKLYEELSAKVGRIEKGDMLVTGGGSIGIPYLVETNEPLYFKDADLLWFKIREAVDSHYLYTFLSSDPFRRHLKSISHIGTIAHYTVEQAKSTPLRLPKTIPEQTQIGGYFRELDRLIGLHQRKHDKLAALKKAMLQKMFPQAGGTTPEIRFKGFSGEWVETKLGDVGLFYRGISYNATNVCGSGLLVLRSSNIQSSRLILDSDLQFVNKECPEEISLRKGDIAICMSNGSKALVGKSAVCESNPVTPTTVGAFCSIYRSENTLSPYLLQTVKYSNYLHELLAGSSINNLKNSDLCNLIFRIPPKKPEQQKIATYFRKLDDLISKHAIQLQKLKQIKYACLEKMFV